MGQVIRLMRKISFFLLFSSMFSAIGKNICEPIVETLNPFFDPDFQIPKETTPLINEEYIVSKMVGLESDAECYRFLNHISETANTNSKFKKYFNLVFSHLPEFSIHIYHQEEKLSGNNSAAYISNTITMLLPTRELNDSFVFYRFLRHEFLHAAMHAVQRVLSNNPSSVSDQPYFPDTKEEKDKFNKLMKIGDARAANLREQIKLEMEESLDSKRLSTLRELRKEILNEYQKYYKLSFEINFPKNENWSLKQFKNDIQAEFGRVDTEIVHSSKGDTIRITFIDPLAAAVYTIFNYIDKVKKESYPHQYLSERHAYLYEFIPQKILNYLYPELEAYTQGLLHRAVSTPISQTARRLHTFLTFEEHQTAGKLKVLKDPEAFRADEAPYFISMALWALKIGEVEAAKTGLNTLITKGYLTDKANLQLARIHYQQKNYHQAVTHFKQAQNKPGLFSKKDKEDFSHAARKIKRSSPKF